MKKEVLWKPVKKVFLISCVSQKLDRSAPAKNLYTSGWFRKAWAYCLQRSGLGVEIYILSAKHGLLWSEDYVDPYEMSLLDMPANERKSWAAKVLRQLDMMTTLNGLKIYILAGEKYREYMVPLLKEYGAIVKVPMAGLGIGEQLAYLKKSTNTSNNNGLTASSIGDIK